MAAPIKDSRPGLEFETRLREAGCAVIAGVDEVGRGCLAGPVVAAAVVLPVGFSHRLVNDSKRLSPPQRDACYEALTSDLSVTWTIGAATVEEIDRMNILRASQEAMRRAVLALSAPPQHALVDGLPFSPFPVPQTAVVGGDRRSLSIAAASIIAKVSRDRLMAGLDSDCPGYGFATHKGYGTPAHLDALERLGASPHHRTSFAPVRKLAKPAR